MNYISKISKESSLKIKTVLKDFETYWNDKNSSKMASLFTKDAEFTDIMGQVALGSKKIEDMHDMVFQKVMKHAIMSLYILYIREIASDKIMTTCKWTTTGHTDQNGVKLPDRTGIMTIVISSSVGNWMISLVQNFDFTTMYNSVDSYNMRLYEN